MPTPQNAEKMRELDAAASRRLLGYGSYLGRVAFVVNGEPMVLPVNYIHDDATDSVIYRTHSGSQLEHLSDARVAFEVDSNRPLDRSGWSVVVRGTTRRVTSEEEVDRLRRGPLKSWAWQAADIWFSISIDAISGRQVGHAEV